MFALVHTEVFNSESEVAQLCPTLYDPMDGSLPGFSIHGIFQARIPEWVAISFSRDLPDPGTEPGSPSLQAGALPSEPPGEPLKSLTVFESKLAGTLPCQKAEEHLFLWSGLLPCPDTADSVKLEGMGDRWNDHQVNELASLGTTRRVKPSDNLLRQAGVASKN